MQPLLRKTVHFINKSAVTFNYAFNYSELGPDILSLELYLLIQTLNFELGKIEILKVKVT